MRFLISGGPTREFLDDVRYLGNPSTGSMGIAVANAAVAKGHDVTLILGPTHLTPPPSVTSVCVVSALEMHEAMISRAAEADAIVMTAAVSDYRPAHRVDGKIKKGDEELSLPLRKNPDILWELGKMGLASVLVGFALEAASPSECLDLARGKLKRKNLDLIVLNRRGSFGGSGMEDVSLVERDGQVTVLGAPTKDALASELIAFCERRDGNERGVGKGSDR